MRLKQMTCKSITEKQINGIKIIEVKWQTGTIEATSRAVKLNQYIVGNTYSGNLTYLPNSTIRIFEAKYDSSNKNS